MPTRTSLPRARRRPRARRVDGGTYARLRSGDGRSARMRRARGARERSAPNQEIAPSPGLCPITESKFQHFVCQTFPMASGFAYEPGRTLPAAWYTQSEWLDLEQERIFERSWQFVGWLGGLDAPGSFLTTTLGRVPVVVVRGEDRELRAFVNVCRHRGSELVGDATGKRMTLQCRYHAWTYNLDGSLSKAPRLDPSDRCDPTLTLEQLRLETVGPFVFVSADPEPESLSTLAAAWPQL